MGGDWNILFKDDIITRPEPHSPPFPLSWFQAEEELIALKMIADAEHEAMEELEGDNDGAFPHPPPVATGGETIL